MAIFSVTIFLGAALLFLVQPMFAKMALPLLGGAPAVWNTCVFFFQAALLAGYAYAHASVRWLGVRRQALVHAALLFAPFAVLPIKIGDGWTPPAATNPIGWMLVLLTASVGLPFALVAASAPLVQRWFSMTRHPSARDPFFLYAASNLGSLAGLLLYPAAIEPALRLARQSALWAWGYGALVALSLACIVAALGGGGRAPVDADASADRSRSSSRARLRWVALALVPSSLMLSVTTYISTDIAAVPLLWVVPLAMYLASFVLTFAPAPPFSHRLMSALLPVAVLAPVISIVSEATNPAAVLIALHLAALFVAAMVCHGELARARPGPSRLTGFYLLVATGGVLGGVFNALVAPVLFQTTVEYPIALVAACLLRPPAAVAARRGCARGLLLDGGVPLIAGALTLALVYAVRQVGDALTPPLRIAAAFGVPLLIAALAWPWPRRFGLALAAILLGGATYSAGGHRLLHIDRSFFGINRVLLTEGGRFRVLLHGRTIHGVQSTQPALRREPLSYYHRRGPAGEIFARFAAGRRDLRIGVLGLGAGTLACYAEPGQRWTFFEIDPAVEHIARNARLFTFLADSPAPIEVVLGDARLSLARVPDRAFDFLALDVFSSDAIPVHLLTREALALYLLKVKPGGVIAFHLSNRHLDLRPVLAATAGALRVPALVRADLEVDEADWTEARYPSTWAIVAAARGALAPLADSRWEAPAPRPGLAPWTDDFSNIFGVFRWRH